MNSIITAKENVARVKRVNPQKNANIKKVILSFLLGLSRREIEKKTDSRNSPLAQIIASQNILGITRIEIIGEQKVIKKITANRVKFFKNLELIFIFLNIFKQIRQEAEIKVAAPSVTESTALSPKLKIDKNPLINAGNGKK